MGSKEEKEPILHLRNTGVSTETPVLSVAEAKKYAENQKLYQYGPFREPADGTVHYRQFSLLTPPKDLGVSASVVAYFEFHFTLCWIMFGCALGALPALVTYLTQGGHPSLWVWSTMGNLGINTMQPNSLLAIDSLFFFSVMLYLLWKFQHQHTDMQDMRLKQSARASDYTLMVSIPKSLTDPTKLVPYFQKWGEISAVVIPLDPKSSISSIFISLRGGEKTEITSIGHAFVTFTYHREAIACQNELNRSFWGWIGRYLRTLGMPSQFDVNKCRVRPAPDTTDLLYDNLRFSDLAKVTMLALGLASIFCVVMINLVALVYFLYVERTLESRTNYSALMITLFIIGLSAWMSFLNFTLKRISLFFVTAMRANTKTTEAFFKLAITVGSQVLTGAYAFLIAIYITGSGSDAYLWTPKNAQAIFTVVFSGQFVAIFNSYIKPVNRFKRSKWWTSRAKTQEELNARSSPPDFFVADTYSSILTAVYLTFMFSNGIPLLPIVTCILFFCKYWLEKYNLLRRCAKPAEVEMWPFSAISNEALMLSVLAHTLLGLILYGQYIFRMTGYSIGNFSEFLVLIGLYLLPTFYLLVFVLIYTPFRYIYLLRQFIRSRIQVPKHVYIPYGKVSNVESYIAPNSLHSTYVATIEPGKVQSSDFATYWINPNPSQEDGVPHAGYKIVSASSSPDMHKN